MDAAMHCDYEIWRDKEYWIIVKTATTVLLIQLSGLYHTE